MNGSGGGIEFPGFRSLETDRRSGRAQRPIRVFEAAPHPAPHPAPHLCGERFLPS